MGELQATLEFHIQLHKFYNVDLFQRGFYQIRTNLKLSPRLAAKIEVNLPRSSNEQELVFPACVVNGAAVSKTFQILYRNEEVTLNDVVIFRVHILVDAHKVEEMILKSELQLVLELWFTEHSFGPEQHNSISCVSTRVLFLHLYPSQGLHYHLPVLFDYFHLAALTLSIHSSLLAIHQPYISTAKPKQGNWLGSPKMQPSPPQPTIESVLFGNLVSFSHSLKHGRCSPFGSRLAHARQVHREVCSLLLSSYDALYNNWTQLLKLLPPWQQMKLTQPEGAPHSKLFTLTEIARNCNVEDEFVVLANNDIAQLCAQNILLWQHFLEAFSGREQVRAHLSQIHHNARVRRFAEAFFVVDNPRPSAAGCYDANYQNYVNLSELTRRSRYWNSLSPLPVECPELDGISTSLPIIFQDSYQDVEEFARRRSVASKKSEGISSGESTTPPSLPEAVLPRARTVEVLRNPEPELSSSNSDITSEQSGWVSNSSGDRDTSEISSGQVSPVLSQSTVKNGSKPLVKESTVESEESVPAQQTSSSKPKSEVKKSSEKDRQTRPEDIKLKILEHPPLPPPKEFQDPPSSHYSDPGPTMDQLPPLPPKAFRDSPKHRKRIPLRPFVSDDEYHIYERVKSRKEEMASSLHAKKSPGEDQANKPNGLPVTQGNKSLKVKEDEYWSTKCTVIEMLLDERKAIEGHAGPPCPPPRKHSRSNTMRVPSESSHAGRKCSCSSDTQVVTGAGVVCECCVSRQQKGPPKPPAPIYQNFTSAAFLQAKDEFKQSINFSGSLYSDLGRLASSLPYFSVSDDCRTFHPTGLHLVVCVHGLDGNSADLRLVRAYLEMGLPGTNLDFLMSEHNEGDTFSDLETMTDKLVAEILYYMEVHQLKPTRVSFIGHSLGTLLVRSAIQRPQLQSIRSRLHTFLSLSGPHLGTLYNNSGLVNMGLWLMQKWKKSGSLLQLSLKDQLDPRQTFLYKLAQGSMLHHFKHVVLCGSAQDRYVPLHSARIQLCKPAVKDASILGAAYREMVHHILQPIVENPEMEFVRYDIHHALPNTANSLIGRAAHIAVLDSELFIEKFLAVAGLKYFE